MPQGYVFGTALADTATWADATFSSLGVTPGVYEWTWGSGAHADSFTLEIGAGAFDLGNDGARFCRARFRWLAPRATVQGRLS